ncbi:hypothetical protein KAFR_0D00490 [Kazachstania africana CBS 2517]|uniref:Nitroreductase domain-containing protein n=1 Tax=Kazachstania africana (strain ATCC 22294 / BCRC 22015 / CBS 2517 / CECT 1963 / NBRC 1671 / NRRL Y-8276) TaxID=1071382 RepID=H2ATJ6_KAZAF|nr:hypothetical protein KAFR_0D00490 [Kazachstania africana CBS 2517]CCF57696.1 hypothetical protein KAFR_0D00490 [Kazachstania africana CBS 2517]
MSTSSFLSTIASRRTIYELKPELPAGVTIEHVQNAVQQIIKETPTAFNCQLLRAVVLTGETHKKVWDHVASAMPDAGAKKRPESVRDEAYGSVIFFTDDNITKKLQSDFAAFAEVFPRLGAHSSGASQINSWAAIESLGLGAHLQHYNDLVRAALPEKIPANWGVHSQLCFGARAGQPGEKTYINNPVEIFN